jgi:heat shock protein HslJ
LKEVDQMLRIAIVAGMAGVMCLLNVPSAQAAATSPIALERTSWKAIELGGRPVGPAKRGLEARLVLENGRLTGADGCNPLKGTYQTMGPAIKFGNVSSGIACLGGTETGRALRKALAAAHVFRIKEERLEFFDGTGTILARFAAPGPKVKPSVAAPALAGTAWQLVKFQGPDNTRLQSAEPASYTLAFAADGRLGAVIGCHRARSTWEASGHSELQFGALTLKGSSCSGPLHDHQVANLPRVKSYSIRGGHLYLALMGDGGVYEYEPSASRAKRQ